MEVRNCQHRGEHEQVRVLRRFIVQEFSGPLSQKSDKNWRMRTLNGESRACVDSCHFFVTTDLKIPVQ